MQTFHANMKRLEKRNDDFRRVLFTGTSYAPPQQPDGTVHHTKRDTEVVERDEERAPAPT